MEKKTSQTLFEIAGQIKGRVLRHLIRDQARQVALLEASLHHLKSRIRFLEEELQSLRRMDGES